MNREAMLKRVQVADFALYEARLFLDTHPDDKTAQDYYKKHLDLAKTAVTEFEAKFGPLKAENYDGGSWDWISDRRPARSATFQRSPISGAAAYAKESSVRSRGALRRRFGCPVPPGALCG